MPNHTNTHSESKLVQGAYHLHEVIAHEAAKPQGRPSIDISKRSIASLDDEGGDGWVQEDVDHGPRRRKFRFYFFVCAFHVDLSCKSVLEEESVELKAFGSTAYCCLARHADYQSSVRLMLSELLANELAKEQSAGNERESVSELVDEVPETVILRQLFRRVTAGQRKVELRDDDCASGLLQVDSRDGSQNNFRSSKTSLALANCSKLPFRFALTLPSRVNIASTEHGKALNLICPCTVPVLAGTTANEGDIFIVIAELVAAGVTIQPVLDILSSINTMETSCAMAETTGYRAAAGVSVFRYEYQAILPNISPIPQLRAYHTSEIPLVFGTYNTSANATSIPSTSTGIALSKQCNGWPVYYPSGLTIATLGNYQNLTGWSFTESEVVDALCSNVTF
ncbi:hypothetical protein F5878DRAFT_644143 [Lentinula raphanica]|uniref:Uncharacterized protein n=1 Tax=Lentinula raphanica TaxID=153919 RepID=A0AA38UF05_9AGAR|nr:hypothetical protein F5878DRAFT_644143 [Lentinula raphanica]